MIMLNSARRVLDLTHLLTVLRDNIEQLPTRTQIGIARSVANIRRAVLGQQLSCTIFCYLVHEYGIVRTESDKYSLIRSARFSTYRCGTNPLRLTLTSNE
jgi:hypothetical protein